ncbi:hypothetical protein PAXRUDRAFT_33276 [Paxillus rubicundulus Ve08.2h10]|uniref:Uncharacterized protein n=1 Tax=Paxillus rubicundulus Ve08.2h10 TaxID=930991 RepID=A0A0D0DCE3_9AGAM|nr:hypothetical protein PAXRUDRAFT_33276 [Paxillus rubicundulus Ve08.2h10]
MYYRILLNMVSRVVQSETVKVEPSQLLSLLISHRTATYALEGIIYLGNFHFSAWLIKGSKIWLYDGHENGGSLQLETLPVTVIDLEQLAGQKADICMYLCIRQTSPLTSTHYSHCLISPPYLIDLTPTFCFHYTSTMMLKTPSSSPLTSPENLSLPSSPILSATTDLATSNLSDVDEVDLTSQSLLCISLLASMQSKGALTTDAIGNITSENNPQPL